MLTWIQSTVLALATWPVVALLFVIYLLCSQGFAWRQKALGFRTTLDARGWYTPAEASSFLSDIGREGRRYYAFSQMTLDVVFPLTYGALFAILIVRLYSARGWLLVPLLTVAFDLLENVTTAYLALSYADREVPLSWIAAVFTLVKTILFLGSLVLILIGGVKGLL